MKSNFIKDIKTSEIQEISDHLWKQNIWKRRE